MKGIWALCLVFAALSWAGEAVCEPTPKAASIQVGMLWWPADPEQSMKALKNDVEDCLVDHIRRVAPQVVVVRQQAIRDALFPLLEPSTQPSTEQAFAALLARQDVRQRLAGRGLQYLVAFSGGTREAAPGGMVLCGAGYGGGGCFGFSWQGEATRLDAVLWPLTGEGVLHRETATVEGTSVMPAFVLPLPIRAQSRSAACRELGEHLGQAILKIEAGNTGAGGAHTPGN